MAIKDIEAFEAFWAFAPPQPHSLAQNLRQLQLKKKNSNCCSVFSFVHISVFGGALHLLRYLATELRPAKWRMLPMLRSVLSRFWILRTRLQATRSAFSLLSHGLLSSGFPSLYALLLGALILHYELANAPKGGYCLLPRTLFYITLIFALVGRRTEWLVGGALVAAMGYSGAAAVHACLLVWRGPASGELDAWALVAILGATCIIMVPLLNWSTTLRNLGKLSGSQGAYRTIIVCWGVLVAVGLFSILIMAGGLGPRYDWIRVVSPTVDEIFNYTITCTIYAAGSDFSQSNFRDLNYTLLQQYQGTDYLFRVLDKEWISEYNCSAIYPDNGPMAIFRSQEDYRVLASKEMDTIFPRLAGNLTPSERQARQFEMVTQTLMSPIISYIILQGIWTVLFGRRNPRQVRDVIYLYLRRPSPNMFKGGQGRNSTQRRKIIELIAKYTALSAYAWAIIATLLCIPVLVVSIVACELFMRQLPQAESPIHIGAWSPWAIFFLVICAAIIIQFNDKAGEVMRSTLIHFRCSRRQQNPSLPTTAQPQPHELQLQSAMTSELDEYVSWRKRIVAEWHSFRNFYHDANSSALHTNREGEPDVPAQADKTLSVSANDMNEITTDASPIPDAHKDHYITPARSLHTNVASNGNADPEALQSDPLLTDHVAAMQTLPPAQSASSEAPRTSHRVPPLENAKSAVP